MSWNQGFPRLFPEQAGHIAVGEPYAENLRRFYRRRLDASEMDRIEAYVAEGLERHRRQTEPFEFLNHGQWLRVAVLDLPGLGRLRAWSVVGPSRDSESLARQMALAGKTVAAEAMEQIADGLMMRDAAGRILLANRRFAALYGFGAPGHVVGMTFRELLAAVWAGAPGGEAALTLWDDASRFPGAPFELPLPGDRWVRVRDLRSLDGALVSTHVEVTDLIRLQRSADEARARAEDLAARLGAEMAERKRSEARTVGMARLASLGEMATGLAHELNQPLATLTLAADVAAAALQREGAAAIPEAVERLERIAATALRAREVVNHVRLFGRADQPGRPSEPVDLGAAARGALALIEAAIRALGVRLETELPLRPVLVMGQLIALEQVILNLLMNARDAVEALPPGTGVIRLRVTAQAGQAEVLVADNGGGFSEAALRQGLEPFFTTKPPGKGTGIGLSLAYATVTQAGGGIALANEGGGAVVRVRLPLAPLAEGAGA